MKFVEKAARGIVPWTSLVAEMDTWDPANGITIHDMLGFDEREWAMIVQCNAAAPYIIQERSWRMGFIKVPQVDYSRLIGCMAPVNTKPEDVIKGFNPSAIFNNLLKSGVIDKIPDHLFFNYKAYGWNNQKLFIDLADVANMKFNWALYDIPKSAPEAPSGWQPTPDLLKQKDGPSMVQIASDHLKEDVIEVKATLIFEAEKPTVLMSDVMKVKERLLGEPLMHGDESHRKWLKETIEAEFASLKPAETLKTEE